MDKKKIDALHISAMNKLLESIEGTENYAPGPMQNMQAPCLIRSAIYDLVAMQNEINKTGQIAQR